MYISFCKCGRRILTTGQQKENKPCEICQKEHAESLKDRVIEAQQKEET